MPGVAVTPEITPFELDRVQARVRSADFVPQVISLEVFAF